MAGRFAVLVAVMLAAAPALAAGEADPSTPVVLALAVILASAKLGGHIATRSVNRRCSASCSRASCLATYTSSGSTPSITTSTSRFSRGFGLLLRRGARTSEREDQLELFERIDRPSSRRRAPSVSSRESRSGTARHEAIP